MVLRNNDVLPPIIIIYLNIDISISKMYLDIFKLTINNSGQREYNLFDISRDLAARGKFIGITWY
jgi:hypothetical protein